MSAAAKSVDNRDASGRFGPGNNANPGGRPKKIAELSQAVRDKIEPAKLADLWWEIATDPERKDSDRLEASRLLADRGWGKAADFKPQEDGDPLGLNDARDRLMGKLAPVAALDDRRAESSGSS